MNSSEIISVVDSYIHEKKLFSKSDRILVGLSGGPDSVVLLHILLQLKYKICAAHCNFHLRDEESNRDQLFVENFAQKQDVLLHKIDFDTNQYVKLTHQSTEMAARELRYNWFQKLCTQYNYKFIAIAHHIDDAEETFFINLCRGTSIHGLTGIRVKNELIVRPLLCINREQILNYLKENQLDYVIDSTNNENVFIRNKFRNEIIPQITAFNSSFKKNLCKTINNINQCESFVDHQINNIKKSIKIPSKDGDCFDLSTIVLNEDYHFILFEILHSYDFSSTVINDIALSSLFSSGKTYFSKNYKLLKNRQFLIIQRNDSSLKIENQNCFPILNNQMEIKDPIHLEICYLENNKIKFEKNNNNICYADLDLLHFPLIIRHWQMGDLFKPYGLNGVKKVSDFFINNKISIIDKQKIWILTSQSNEIIWIIGYRTDGRFCITPNTKNVIKFHLI